MITFLKFSTKRKFIEITNQGKNRLLILKNLFFVKYEFFQNLF